MIDLMKINYDKLRQISSEQSNIPGVFDIEARIQYAIKGMFDYIDFAFLEYLKEKGMTLEDAKRECEVRRYPDKTELWHNGELIFTAFISLPKEDKDNPLCIKYTCKVVKHWKGEEN